MCILPEQQPCQTEECQATRRVNNVGGQYYGRFKSMAVRMSLWRGDRCSRPRSGGLAVFAVGAGIAPSPDVTARAIVCGAASGISGGCELGSDTGCLALSQEYPFRVYPIT